MKAILHCDRVWGIGRRGDLMFHLPKDMAFFKSTTIGKICVMGSNTLLSFPHEKPLKNRTNIVLWPDGDPYRAEKDGFILVQSLKRLFEELKKYNTDDIYVIGGASMYKTLLPYCSEVLVTKVDADGGADVFFPNLDEDESWDEEARGEDEEDNGYLIRFCRYRNKNIKVF